MYQLRVQAEMLMDWLLSLQLRDCTKQPHGTTHAVGAAWVFACEFHGRAWKVRSAMGSTTAARRSLATGALQLGAGPGRLPLLIARATEGQYLVATRPKQDSASALSGVAQSRFIGPPAALHFHIRCKAANCCC